MKVHLIRRSARRAALDARVCFIADTRRDRPWIERHVLKDPAGARARPQRARRRHAVGGTGYAVCTHGKRDPCCARRGRPLARALKAARPEQTEIGHIGGHRFAATFLAFPHGLAFGRVPAAAGPRIVAGSKAGEIDLDHLRGRAGDPPTAQAADVLVRRSWGCAGSTTSWCSTSTAPASPCEVRRGGSASGSCAMSGRRDRSRAATPEPVAARASVTSRGSTKPPDARRRARRTRPAAPRGRGARPSPGPEQLLLKVHACGSAAPTCTSATARSSPAPTADPRSPDRRRHARRRAGRRAMAGLGRRHLRVLPLRPREPLPPRALHRPRHRRRLRRVDGRRRAVLPPAPRRDERPRDRAAVVRRPDRPPGRCGWRATVSASVSTASGSAHIICQVAVHEGGACSRSRARTDRAQSLARSLGAEWAGDAMAPGPSRSTRRSSSRPPACSSRPLRATAPGGTVVCAGIHMTDIPSFPYRDLWEERVLRSVANLTRADAQEFLALAPQVPVRTTVQEFASSRPRPRSAGCGPADRGLGRPAGHRSAAVSWPS